MFQIKTRELSLTTTTATFEVKIDDEKMNKRIVKIIDKLGDQQNHRTNDKTQTTDWKLMEQPGFKQLAEIIVNTAARASEHRYNHRINAVITEMWGLKYKSEEVALPHDHYPSTWSCVYYINPPEA